MIAGPLTCNGAMAFAEPIAGQVCPLCGGAGRFYGAKDGYALRECRDQHAPILLSWQWASEEEYERLYCEAGRYHSDCQRDEGQAPSWERDTAHLKAALARLNFLKQMMPNGSLLDIGAGTGAFTAAAMALGYDASGIEPDVQMVLAARTLGRQVESRDWREVCINYDIITLHDVWEHLTQPLTCLQLLRDRLTTRGLIVIELPEWDCPQAQREGLQWKHIRPLQHLFLPSDNAARAMFERAGLVVEAAIRPLRGQLGKIAYYLGV